MMAERLEERREALVGRIYDAALDRSLWSGVLEGIADLTSSAAALMHGYSVTRKLYTFHELGRSIRTASAATNSIILPIRGCVRAAFRPAMWSAPTI
jgi:hypothetical protein